MSASFDMQPVLQGETLRLRPLQALDREALFAAAADPLIWEQHPAKTRHNRAVFDPYFDFLLSTGSTLVVEDPEGHVIGASRYYLTDETPPCPSIGFTFLTRAHWGGDANREMKRLMLDHMFTSVPSAWFHIGPDNIRSRKATEKLGAVWRRQATLDLGTGAARYDCLEVTREIWADAAA